MGGGVMYCQTFGFVIYHDTENRIAIYCGCFG